MPSDAFNVDHLDDFPAPIRSMIVVASMVGWGVRRHEKGYATILSPDGSTQITLPSNARSIRQSVTRTWWGKVFRYGDPSRVQMLKDFLAEETGEVSFNELKDMFVKGGPLRDTLTRFIADHHGDFPTAQRTFLEAVHNQAIEMGAIPDDRPKEEPQRSVTEQPKPSNGPATLVIERPWQARHTMRASGGEVYESAAVIEQQWSDGSLSYRCSQCDFTSPIPRTVASHYGGKHGRERPTRSAQELSFIDPTVRWVPTERQRGRIARLATEIDGAKTELGADATATAIAEWIVQRRDEASAVTERDTTLTPDGIIDRIRRLVDGGVYADLMARITLLESEVSIAQAKTAADSELVKAALADANATAAEEKAEYEEAIATLRKELHDARERANDAESDLDALRDLLAKRPKSE